MLVAQIKPVNKNVPEGRNIGSAFTKNNVPGRGNYAAIATTKKFHSPAGTRYRKTQTRHRLVHSDVFADGTTRTPSRRDEMSVEKSPPQKTSSRRDEIPGRRKFIAHHRSYIQSA